MSAKPFFERLREGEEVILACLNFITQNVNTLLLYTTYTTRQAKTAEHPRKSHKRPKVPGHSDLRLGNFKKLTKSDFARQFVNGASAEF